ncbi:Xre family transcriptional regulator [Rhodopseudomonas thermotolerans]|uniref:Xre family transcriptional regulator n=2 Tax=Rhodopseudomonas TaxID=1073 RepID=A0A336JVL5_9BRAD|nr:MULTISPECIES: XRE family transcriptional regulator [Rhodopseudomonas]RED21711.1 Xre family transcriptional regulator [Rhodopseudomonas pentothenatexigens]REF88224.1 Xre family transcriptional regulator [Rhodopseudomonas thermotolerans]SSW93640.1 Xre family transcriptional regulator [Rhodopseudomonas pentothenatexigens]
MAGDSGKKLFVGPRFRRIRQQLGLSQTQIAEGLGISPSYVNLIERNQRPVTAQILLRLAETYDLDLRDLATADEDRFFAELNEIFSDPLFRQIDLPKQELRDLAELCPGVTHSLQRLYAAYTEARRGETMVAAQMADREQIRYEANPIERIRDLIEANRNYFPELEQAAEAVRDELNVGSQEMFGALTDRLRERHSITTRIMPVDVMRETLRRFDRHRRQLLISELIDSPGRAFQVAFQTGLTEHGGVIDAIVHRAGGLEDQARRLYRITLGNYFAAAVMMPYAAFHAAAEQLSYDVNVLAQRFNAGFEQVCHRLTTLQRPNARGVPFFMLRVDNAGNVSKRFSSGTFPFSKFGGTCPLWNVHSTFDTPDRLLKQVIELPDGSRYFSIAQMVRRPIAPHPQPQPRFAIGLGCEIRHASKLIYAAGMDLEKAEGTPIGVNCRLCEREHCSQRAEPPITRTLILDENTRRASSFAFSNAREL